MRALARVLRLGQQRHQQAEGGGATGLTEVIDSDFARLEADVAGTQEEFDAELEYREKLKLTGGSGSSVGFEMESGVPS